MSTVQNAMPVPNVLLDTDLGGDIDDLGALAVLHALADQERCRIAGVVSDSDQAPAVSAIQAVNRWYGRSDIPVTCPEQIVDTNTYAKAVAGVYSDLPDPFKTPRSPAAFRRMLAEAEDGSVIIVTIGWLTQMRRLMFSGPDAISPLPGIELIRKKVRKVVTMGGRYPDGVEPDRADPNFRIGTEEDASRGVISQCPVPMIFSGMELGSCMNGYSTGARLMELPKRHPLRTGYTHFFNFPPDWALREPPFPKDIIQPWAIYDQIAVYYAVTEDKRYFREVRGANVLDENSFNVFHPSDNGPHSYLVPAVAPETIANNVIEPLMLTRPQPAGTLRGAVAPMGADRHD